MDIPVQVRLGLSGPVASIGRIRLDPNAVRAGAGQYGSYYVLEMGRHYEQYVVTGYLPSLPMVHGITTAHPFVQATKKTRAASVTGNIGEVIAALTVRRKLTTVVRHIRHINTSRKYRTPDYLMRFDPMLPSEFALVLPAGIIAAFPDWPVESKGKQDCGGNGSSDIKGVDSVGGLLVLSGAIQRVGGRIRHDRNINISGSQADLHHALCALQSGCFAC